MDPIQESTLNSLKKELIILKASIKETAFDIIDEGFSKFPIFIAHYGNVNIGETILDRVEMALNWSINASTLEEFLERGIIQQDKEAVFKSNFKNPKEQACIFMVTPEIANFIFVPY